jgi:hypothetical protein
LNNTEEPINGEQTVTDNVSFYAKFTLPGAAPISDVTGLNTIRAGLSGKYILTDNISLSGLDWEPIGTFTGILDGNGHKITGLSVDREVAGLFGYISGGVISDLTIEVTSVKGESLAGGLAGSISGNAEISDVYITGTGVIQAESSGGIATSAGGIAGAFSGSLLGCGNTNAVYSTTNSTDSVSGGIAGYLSSGSTIADCYNTGEVYSASSSGSASGWTYSYSGGIAGSVDDDRNTTTIKNCYNTGKISSSSGSAYGWASSSYSNSGGIAGYADTYGGSIIITDSYNTGEVSSSSGPATVWASFSYSNSGGITGYASGTYAGMVTVTNCYNEGNLSSFSGPASEGGYTNSNSGGIMGNTDATSGTITITNNAAINKEISAEYPSRIVTGTFGCGAPYGYVCAVNNFAFKGMQASGATDGTDKTDDALKDRATYESAVNGDGDGGLGWLFGDDGDHPWKMPQEGNEHPYPILYWQE